MRSSLLFFVLLALISCRQDEDFRDYYGGSGIWEIKNLEISYFSDSTASQKDSIRNYPDCGMFILYNNDIGAGKSACMGQLGITTTEMVNTGFLWYFENGKLLLAASTQESPFRTFTTSGSGDNRTWEWQGMNQSLLPGKAVCRSERYTLKRLKTR